MIAKISSSQNPLVKHLVKLRDDRSYRQKCGTVLVEGKNLIKEINITPKVVLVEDETLLPKGCHPDEIFLVNRSIINKISGVETPEGIIAEVPLPEYASLSGVQRLLVLDRISDPGNMGTLLRTALALGWDGVYLLKGCCDPYNDKALRASKGSVFRIPMKMGKWDEVESLIKKNKLTVFGADLDGVDAGQAKVDGGIALILGNESQGLSAEALSLCKKITIPMPGEMESLNVAVAGGILMHLLGK